MDKYWSKILSFLKCDTATKLVVSSLGATFILSIILIFGVSLIRQDVTNDLSQRYPEFLNIGFARMANRELNNLKVSDMPKVKVSDMPKETDKPKESDRPKETDKPKKIENYFDNPDTTTKEFVNVKNNVENILKKYKGTYGVYYYELNSNKHFGINHEDEYVAASTVKVPLNLYLNKEVKNGNIDLNEELEYCEEDYEGGTGQIRYQKFGGKYKLRRLAELSITHSDNVATRMLIRHLGRAKYKNFMRECGGAHVIDNVNVSSPLDMAKYLKNLYDSYTSADETAAMLIENLQNTIYNTRIPRNLPKDLKISHKIGSQVRVVNDVGIIFTKNPYILCVMSKNVNEGEADVAIGNISEAIYYFNIANG